MSDKVSNERLRRVIEILEWFKDDYDPVCDEENFEAMRDAIAAIDELIARRTVEVKPVKLPDDMQMSDAVKANITTDFMDGFNVRGVLDAKAIKAAGVTIEEEQN